MIAEREVKQEIREDLVLLEIILNDERLFEDVMSHKDHFHYSRDFDDVTKITKEWLRRIIPKEMACPEFQLLYKN